MKLADSLNPATQAENIKKLNAGLEAVDAKTLPSRSTATTGQILKLTGENKTPSWADEYSYIPPAYSETETPTGQKWIDGKDIYSIVIKGQFPEITQASNRVIGTLSLDSVVLTALNFETAGGIYRVNNNILFTSSTNNITVVSVSPTYSEYNYTLILLYTKPDPAPETRDDDTQPEEPETKKTTRKKGRA